MTKVLVVDDSLSIRKVLELTLLSRRMEVMLAESAEAAFAQLSQVTSDTLPDVIIADILMPDEDGIALTKKLKADTVWQDIPVLLISGVVNARVREQAKRAGAVVVLKKPFDSEELFEHIERVAQAHANASIVKKRPAKLPLKVFAHSKISPEASQKIRDVLRPFARHPDVYSVMLVNHHGQVILGLGERQRLIPALYRMLLGTANSLGNEASWGSMRTMLIEYQTQRVFLGRISHQAGLLMFLRDTSRLEALQQLLEKQHSKLLSLPSKPGG